METRVESIARAPDSHESRPGPVEFLREQHRRVVGVLRRMEMASDRNERIEYSSTVSEEIREFVSLEETPLREVMEPMIPAHFTHTGAAYKRRAHLLSLCGALEAAALNNRDPARIANQIFSCWVIHMGAAKRALFPAIENLPHAQAEDLEARLRDAKERMAEH